MHDEIFLRPISPKFIARAYSTGTTLLLTPKCLLTYIKRTMYKRSSTSIASFSSESEILASYPEIVRKYKENSTIRFSRSREKLPTGRRLRNYTYGYATLSSEFHNHLRGVHNSTFTSMVTMTIQVFGYWNGQSFSSWFPQIRSIYTILFIDDSHFNIDCLLGANVSYLSPILLDFKNKTQILNKNYNYCIAKIIFFSR